MAALMTSSGAHWPMTLIAICSGMFATKVAKLNCLLNTVFSRSTDFIRGLKTSISEAKVVQKAYSFSLKQNF